MISPRMFLLAWLAVFLAAADSRLRGQTTEPAVPSRWENVTANLGGEKWGFGGVTTMAAIPASDVVIAGISEMGLWATMDDGKTWSKLGAKDSTPIANHPYQIVFDPKNPLRFWESGDNGPGVFRTDNGGLSFQRLGNINNVDGIGIDFTDEKRMTLVVGLHDQERSLHRSIDGGNTWKKIGDKLPEKTNISNDVLVFDSKTYVANAAGWKRDGAKLLAFGTFRTVDGGASFTKVSDAGPSGPALLASDGTIYWQTLWSGGLIKSADQGKTWTALAGPVKVNPIELPGGKLVAAVDAQLHASTDGGRSWQKLGDPIPFQPNGLVFCAKTRSLFAWRSTDAKEEMTVVRWEVP